MIKNKKNTFEKGLDDIKNERIKTWIKQKVKGIVFDKEENDNLSDFYLSAFFVYPFISAFCGFGIFWMSIFCEAGVVLSLIMSLYICAIICRRIHIK